MIYFIQDSARNHIKIGFTEADNAEVRRRALQTSNAAELKIIFTMPGDRKTEKELHEQFASSRECGEWFRPSPELLAYIVEGAGIVGYHQGTHCKEHANSLRQADSHILDYSLRVYLAGKIGGHFWRHHIVKGLTGCLGNPALLDGTNMAKWPVLERAILGRHHYVGPYYIVGSHYGCFSGPNSHGVGADHPVYCCATSEGLPPDRTVAACLGAIDLADVVFAWIDSPDCYGTIAEIGYARAARKRIWIAGPATFPDMWFVYKMADLAETNHPDHTPRQVLESWLECHWDMPSWQQANAEG